MRRSRGIAAIVAGAVLSGAGGGALFSVCSSAIADIADPSLDEPMRTAPETLPDFSATPIEQPQALVDVVRAPTPPLAVEYAEAAAAAVGRAAAPALRQAEQVQWDREPRLALGGERRRDGAERAELTVALGGGERTPTPGVAASGRLAGLRDRLTLPREADRKGRWLLFASDEKQAVGLNLLRGRSGEMRRVSLSADKVAAIGDLTAGIGWRKGGFQASLAFVDREVSIYGRSKDEQFVAFTLSIKPRARRGGRAPAEPERLVARPRPIEPSYYPPRSNPE
ncbi:MAG TPA: hypothetical protein VEA15_02240 [Caulobacteraceae bacterium]|nr:hypothetical protein [Caulobacteraceae bacterium]